MDNKTIEKPNGLSWEHVKNERGIDMAIINRQSLVDFMLYAEQIQQELDELKSASLPLNSNLEELREKFTDLVGGFLEVKDMDTIFNFFTKHLSKDADEVKELREENKNYIFLNDVLEANILKAQSYLGTADRECYNLIQIISELKSKLSLQPVNQFKELSDEEINKMASEYVTSKYGANAGFFEIRKQEFIDAFKQGLQHREDMAESDDRLIRLLTSCWSTACASGHNKFPSLSEMQKDYEAWLTENKLDHLTSIKGK